MVGIASIVIIMDKILETSFSLYRKEGTKGKFQFLIFRNFLLALKKI